MRILNLEEQIRQVIKMARDDEACFEGFELELAPDRQKAAAFRKIRRRVRMQMLVDAGLLGEPGSCHGLNESP